MTHLSATVPKVAGVGRSDDRGDVPTQSVATGTLLRVKCIFSFVVLNVYWELPFEPLN